MWNVKWVCKKIRIFLLIRCWIICSFGWCAFMHFRSHLNCCHVGFIRPHCHSFVSHRHQIEKELTSLSFAHVELMINEKCTCHLPSENKSKNKNKNASSPRLCEWHCSFKCFIISFGFFFCFLFRSFCEMNSFVIFVWITLDRNKIFANI